MDLQAFTEAALGRKLQPYQVKLLGWLVLARRQGKSQMLARLMPRVVRRARRKRAQEKEKQFSLTVAIQEVRSLRAVGCQVRLARIRLPNVKRKGFVWFAEEYGPNVHGKSEVI